MERGPARGSARGPNRLEVAVRSRYDREGSAFADHVVLIWTVGDHTYGFGFYNVHGLRQTLNLDLELAGGIRLVTPDN
jgi:hypothetical protein